MADEIEVFSRMKVTNGNNTHTRVWGTIKEDQAATGVSDVTQKVGTTEETITYGDIAPGLVCLRNTDTTNYVQWGFATTDYGGRLLPGSIPTFVYLDTTSDSIYVKANTAECKVNVILYEA